MNNNRKPTFFTSDLHLGHKKILEYSNRPFKDLDEMHESLIHRFNSVVPTDGITYFLGDVGMGKGSIIKDIISQMNGTKVLILGNHDRGINACYMDGFDVVTYGMRLVIFNELVTLSHCPLFGIKREDTSEYPHYINWHGESRQNYDRYGWTNEGQFHLHGHVHSIPSRPEKSMRSLGRQYDVGIDANNYTPVSTSQIESWISHVLKTEKYMEGLNAKSNV